MSRQGKLVVWSVVILVATFILVYIGVNLTANLGKSSDQIAAENADERLEKLYSQISVKVEEPIKGQIDLDPADIAETLPDISKYPITVENTTDFYVEIFSSPEKAGTGVDSWLADVARDFNQANIQVNGKTASVKIRNIASGTAADYIKTRTYIPDAFTPSNELWGEIIKANGVKAELITPRLAGNVPGIVISKQKYDALIEKYGAVNVKTVTEAIANNEFAMGYTDPFASSTGMNFLITALHTFDHTNLLSDQAVQGFEQFQANIPFLASTTMQMRDAALSGALDGFVLEYQTFVNSAELKGGYVFTPFGVRLSRPM